MRVAIRSLIMAGLLLASSPSPVEAGVRTLYSPSAQSVGTPMDLLDAIDVIRAPIDQRHGSGWPCGTAAVQYPPITSYTISGRQLAITCPDGGVHEFPFTQTSIAVGQQPCSWLEAPCTWTTEPYVWVTSGNRKFTIFFNKSDVAWASKVANAFWSLGQLRKPTDPTADPGFQAGVAAARAATPRTEDQRKALVQAETLLNSGKAADAARAYKSELGNSPDWAEGHYNLALIYASLELLPEAITEMKRYLYLAPEAKDARAAKDQIYAWEALLPR